MKKCPEPIKKLRLMRKGIVRLILLFAILSLSATSGLEFSATIIGDDTEPPLVIDPTAIPTSIAANGVQEAQLSVNVTDRSGIYSVTVDLTPLGGPGTEEQEMVGSSDTYSATTTAAYGTPPGIYSLRINATDNSTHKNTNTAESIVLMVMAPQVITYDFSTNAGIDRWAYGNQHNARPPLINTVPITVFKRANYNRISADDGRMQEDSSSSQGYYALHRFEFTIAEDVTNITRMYIRWSGRGRHQLGQQGATLYIWNNHTGSYEQLDSSTSTRPTTLEGTITANIEDYISQDGTLMLIAEQNSPQWQFWRFKFLSRLGTDYVKVDITL